MELPLIGLLLLICLAAFFVLRNQTKPAHVTEDAYITVESPLALHECALLATLERTLPDSYRIFTKLRLSDIVVPSMKLSPKEQHAARRHADQFSLAFVLCTQPQMKVTAVVVCEEQSESGDSNTYIRKVLAANGIPVISFKAKAEYYLFEVWVKLSEACPGLFEQPASLNLTVPKPAQLISSAASQSSAAPESPETTTSQPAAPPRPSAPPITSQAASHPCPSCSGNMIRRQVTKGPHAGKFFRVCSNFPTCRQMVALPNADAPSAPAEQTLSTGASPSESPSPPATAQTTPAGAAPVVTAGITSPDVEPLIPPPVNIMTESPVQPMETTKSTLLAAAVTALPVSAMPADVPAVEPQHEQTCTKCGKNMVKMQVAKGAHAGKFFWACSDYPACRQLAPIKD